MPGSKQTLGPQGLLQRMPLLKSITTPTTKASQHVSFGPEEVAEAEQDLYSGGEPSGILPKAEVGKIDTEDAFHSH